MVGTVFCPKQIMIFLNISTTLRHTFSRTEEKKTLGHLNDRLASYISRVKELEMHNSSLQQQVTTVEETNTKEIITMRGLYEGELSQVCTIIPSFAAFQLEFISGKKSSRRNVQRTSKA